MSLCVRQIGLSACAFALLVGSAHACPEELPWQQLLRRNDAVEGEDKVPFRPFLRRPGGRADVGYLKNQLETFQAMHAHWEAVLAGQATVSMTEFLSLMHRISAVGISGDRVYAAAKEPEAYRSDQVLPGLFRHDAKMKDAVEGLKAQGLNIMAKHAGLLPNAHMWLVVDGDEGRRLLRMIRRFRGLAGGAIEFPGFSHSDAWPSNELDVGFRLTHFYPAKQYLPEYVAVFDKMLFELAQMAKSPEFNREVFLKRIASLYHLGIHAHFFLRINKSLLMGMVNYLLMRYGYVPTGIYHGDLDIAALFMSPQVFERYFEQEVVTSFSEKPLDFGMQWR